MITESMMKWRVRRENRLNSLEQEDIRRSLEILDNVLAEFDDDGDTWSPYPASSWRERNGRDDHKELEFTGQRFLARTTDDERTFSSTSCCSSGNSFHTLPLDGSSSQLTSLDQYRKFSAPPVPKRSPATRLSSHENLFLFALENNIRGTDCPSRLSLDNFPTTDPSVGRRTNREGSLSSWSDGSPRNESRLPGRQPPLSNQSSTAAIAELGASPESLLHCSVTSADDEVFRDAVTCRSQRRASCGNLPQGQNSPDDTAVLESSMEKSPSVAKRRADFEMKGRTETKEPKPKEGRVALADESGDVSRPVTNSPFLKRKASGHAKSEIVSSSPESLDTMSEPSQGSSAYPHTRPEHPNIGPEIADCSTEPAEAPSCEERLRKLDNEFAEVKFLLKSKQISILASPPPKFTPPPPPKPPRKQRGPTCAVTAESVAKNKAPDVSSAAKLDEQTKRPEELVDGLCNGCDATNQQKTLLSSTIEDIPRLLPTDTLNRPQLGLSYSMEDDLSPGIKEILTSTPKSDASPKSTFNESFSSLGYGSSQSDLDLQISLKDGDKVPITSLRSQTLPIGTKLTPEFYSDADNESDFGSLNGSKTRQLFDDHDNELSHFRSSSAPPFKHLDDPGGKRRNKFGMSKKDKKTKDKESSYSLKYELSLDEGVTLRKAKELDSNDRQELKFKKGSAVSTTGEKKRRSVWSSILRRN